jgi:hypothetical protein
MIKLTLFKNVIVNKKFFYVYIAYLYETKIKNVHNIVGRALFLLGIGFPSISI